MGVPEIFPSTGLLSPTSAMPQSPDHSSTVPDPNRPAQPAMATEPPYPLTFSQRYGYEPLPEPMRPGEISPDLRREIANAAMDFLSDFRTELVNSGIRREKPMSARDKGHYFSIGIDFNPRTSFPLPTDSIKENAEAKINRYVRHILGRLDTTLWDNTDIHTDDSLFEQILESPRFNKVIDLLEIMFNTPYESDEWKIISQMTEDFAKEIKNLFQRYSSAYSLNIQERPYWFSPCMVIKEQANAVEKAIEVIHNSGIDSAVTHLRQAAEHINMEQYADSLADSIHAVESVARTIASNNCDSLAQALKSLEDAGLLKHRALKDAFIKLYGYTSNEKGIRHALVDKNSADVGLDEAIFMYGACASFAAYLSRKRQHSISECTPGDLNQQRRQDS